MSDQKQLNREKSYQIKLTKEQRAELRELTGLEGEALNFTGQELEERIAPREKGALF